MSYPFIVLIHLLAAFIFIGTVFFEVIFLEKIRTRVPKETMRIVEKEIGTRAKEVIPWVFLILFGAGLALAWFHRHTLSAPFASSAGILLSLKILLAFSVLGHFITAMILRKKGKLRGKTSKIIHISVFCHAITIVILAKTMFYIQW